jgi:hypothetical protein
MKYNGVPSRMAEREGFEPSVRLPVLRFSRPAYSTTLAPLRAEAPKNQTLRARHVGLRLGFQFSESRWHSIANPRLHRNGEVTIANRDNLPAALSVMGEKVAKLTKRRRDIEAPIRQNLSRKNAR